MSAEVLLKHFERITDAPNAIPRLRQLILDLAARGKLVEQVSSDEPASQLLKRIRQQKATLVEAGEIRHEKPHPPIMASPFGLPIGWEWVRLGSVIHLVSGQHLQPPEYTENAAKGPPYITGPADFGPDGLRITRYALVRKAVARRGQLLLTVKGSGVGKTAICNLAEVAISRQLMAMTAIGWNGHFLLVVTHLLAELLKERARSLIPGISREDVTEFVVGMPPLAEQHRIVAKVEELMALCDRLGQAQEERETRRDRLTAASLHQLNYGGDGDNLREDTLFFINHLPVLTTRGDEIQKIRETILNLAIQGRLVVQVATEEPASELLRKIREEKKRLSDEGKITPPVESRLVPGEKIVGLLRPGWQNAKLAEILLELQTGPFGSSLHQSDYQKGGVPVINPASIRNERLVPIDSMAVGPATLERLSTFQLQVGDIVMARRGEMGRCAVVTENEEGWLCGTGSLILRLPSCVEPMFFVKLIGSPQVRNYLGGSAVGATMQNLNQSILLGLILGLPPVEEQRRIVAKIEELMSLCDSLQEKLNTKCRESRDLLEAILHEALNPVTIEAQ